MRRGRKFIIGFSLLLVLALAQVSLAQAGVLEEVRAWLRDYYVDEVPSHVLSAGTVQETLQRLGDPHTNYFTADQFRRYQSSMEEESYSGIGIYIDVHELGTLILAVIKGSPAEEAGLQAGDIILRADGQVMAGLSTEKAATILRGPEGTQVHLVIRRGDAVLEFTVTRREIKSTVVSGEIIEGLGYIRLNTFTDTSAYLFGKMVDELSAKNVDGWIVDIRDNSGGYLDAALQIAGRFIGDKTAVQVRNRDSFSTLEAEGGGTVLQQPVVILVNEYSASASEILASAARDQAGALLVGTTTYGKGTMQSLVGLSDGGVLKLTTYRFYSPLGSNINGVGLTPDIPVELDEVQEIIDYLFRRGVFLRRGGPVRRVAGADRLRTAVEVARTGWPEGANAVVLARADDFADALAGTSLAAKLDAPVLLTYPGGLTQDVKAELARLAPGEVVILGGKGAVSLNVETELKQLGYAVKRIAGADRFETAALIAAELGNFKEAVLVNGHGFADALSVSAYAGSRGIPVLLTRKDGLPQVTRQSLAGVDSVKIVGGTGVVSMQVEQSIPVPVVRVAGDDRYATAVEVAKLSGMEKVFVARGDDFADALAGGAWAAREGGAVVLVRPDSVPTVVRSFLEENVSGITGAVMLGGNTAVGREVQETLVLLFGQEN